MVDDKLVKYVQTQLKAGFSQESIKNALLKAGYSEHDVFDAVSEATMPAEVKPPSETAGTKEKEPELAPPKKSEETPIQVSGAAAFGQMLKKNWIIVVALVVAVVAVTFVLLFILGGVINFGEVGKNFNLEGIGKIFQGAKNCGTDTKCFSAAFKECTSATGTYTTKSRTSAVSFKGTIGGKSGDACAIRVDAISASGALSTYKGESMNCRVPIDLLETIENPLRDLSSLKPHCSGILSSLID